MAKKWSEMTEQEINRLKQQQCMKCEYYSRWAGDGVNHATCEYITRIYNIYSVINNVAGLHGLEITDLRDKKTGKEWRREPHG